MYAPGTPYFIIPLSIIIGLVVPLPFWLVHQKYPRVGADKVVTPIVRCLRLRFVENATNSFSIFFFFQICWTLGYLSVGINSSIFMTMLIALFSQYYLRVHRATWFRKYNVSL